MTRRSPLSPVQDLAVRTEAKRHDSGFTLIEVMIALVITAICLLGLASSSVTALQLVKLADIEAERGFARQEMVETVRSTDFDALGFTSDSVGAYKVWYVPFPHATDPNAKNVWVVTRGPGRLKGTQGQYGGSVYDTLTILVTR